MKATQVTRTRCHTGEGPLWHPEEGCLYYVDIPSGELFHYDPLSGVCERRFGGIALGGFTIQEDGALLLFQGGGQIRRWKDGVFTVLRESLPEEETTRFNDVAADPEGRVFCGTMATGSRPGRLYRLDTDGSITRILEGIGCPNGMGWPLDRRTIYFTDSLARRIYVFDYDRDTGAIGNQRVFAEIPEGGGLPDGLTVDAEGGVWSALWDGYAVVRFSPEGEELMRVEVPCKKASSVTFGGPDYADMYITTASEDGPESVEGPGAGGLFHCVPGVRGLPEFRSKIRF